MTKMTTVSPCCKSDDWIVVSCTNSSRVFVVEPPQPNSTTPDKHGLETSQKQNQIFDSDHHSEHAEFTNEIVCENDNQESGTNQMMTKDIFQLLVWQSGLETPIELVNETQKPLMIVTDKKRSRKELESVVQEMILMHGQLRRIFSQVTRENVSDVIQVCERLYEKWVPLNRNARTKERQCSEDNEKREESGVTRLQVMSKVDHNSDEKWCQLLVESRFEVGLGGNSKDWRRGKFYSDFQENAWRFQLHIGQLVDALDTDNCWYESRVVDMDAVRVKVHYRGWTSKWDEWLSRTSARIALLHTKVPDWRVFQAGDEVLVGSKVPEKRYPEWRVARVTACDIKDDSFQIEVNVDGKKKWLDAQDELLCAKGTHKAVNASSAPLSLLDYFFERPEGLLPTLSQNDALLKEVESVRETTYVTQLADSDADGDEWCVVDDKGDNDDEGTEVVATTESASPADDSVVRYEVAGVDSDGPKYSDTFSNEQCAHGVASPVVDQIFAAAQMNTVVSEENAWRNQLQIDQLIDARDTDNIWYESRVVALSSKLVKLHYRGWTSKWDEWIERTSTRIAPLHTKVQNWRDFKLGSALMVGRHVDTKKHPEWRNAVVTACEACKTNNRLRIEVDVDGRKHWMDAQDEMLCPPGTHKTSNLSMLQHMVPLF